jgi:hypothetical protein
MQPGQPAALAAPAPGEILGYKIGDQVYDPADVAIIRKVPVASLPFGLPGPVDRTGRRWAALSDTELRAYGLTREVMGDV